MTVAASKLIYRLGVKRQLSETDLVLTFSVCSAPPALNPKLCALAAAEGRALLSASHGAQLGPSATAAAQRLALHAGVAGLRGAGLWRGAGTLELPLAPAPAPHAVYWACCSGGGQVLLG
jgi:hypothetical protein